MTGSDVPTCARHPDVPTRVSCSSCGTPICPDCGVESAVGYKCPDCGTMGGAAEPSGQGALGRLGSLGGSGRPTAGSPSPGDGLPLPSMVRATLVGVSASAAGGFLLGFVFAGRTFFLISSGLIGWAVAKAVFWATGGQASPFVRAMALALAGLTVGVGLVTAPGVDPAPQGMLLLAYPAAVYGGWIEVRKYQ